jgi:hypothetical protein
VRVRDKGNSGWSPAPSILRLLRPVPIPGFVVMGAVSRSRVTWAVSGAVQPGLLIAMGEIGPEESLSDSDS